MKAQLTPGKYVVAVSGGVDSMVLLDLLHGLPDVELVVAHFEHGIRKDSDEDRKLVEAAAKKYGLPFVFARGNLGAGVSEATARTVRYNFLRQVQKEQNAQAIITAHHQDDVLETAIFNLMRGTGRKGLSALQSTENLTRPLLHIYKDEILAYAREHHIKWREDSTNNDETYKRNFIRRQIMPRLNPQQKAALAAFVSRAQTSNAAIDAMLDELIKSGGATMGRQWFIMLPHQVSREVMAAWLRAHDVRDFDRPLIERLVIAAKVALPGKLIDVNADLVLHVQKHSLELRKRSPRKNR